MTMLDRPVSVHLAAPALALVAAVALAACGGGGGSAADLPVAGTDVPTNATQSAADATGFVSSTLASSSETAEPIAVGEVVLATSDTTEPADV